MALYEYACQKCGEVFEVRQRMDDPALEWHECGGKLEKLMSPAAIHFKGSGFYETDYKNKF
jgi:putative FmdB family regulatory protein